MASLAACLPAGRQAGRQQQTQQLQLLTWPTLGEPALPRQVQAASGRGILQRGNKLAMATPADRIRQINAGNWCATRSEVPSTTSLLMSGAIPLCTKTLSIGMQQRLKPFSR